ncbi:hypothetical protein M3649_21070 [Ureibacillus chungkukjangi]|uniref:hypothetical protein n=1 Tax=Ureibacillus chungkukjangi TaxID=1202712 RepID=UPI00203DA34B|nr:hypothetical protein [Ureibacillus chungkukjangi]MCM3390579.1 hypothetical protein [Ureibacillus chungkukjangi]
MIRCSKNGKYKAVYSDFDGYITKAQTVEFLVPGMEGYVCGLTVFMEIVIQYLVVLGVPAEKIHYDFLGAAMALQIKKTA